MVRRCIPLRPFPFGAIAVFGLSALLAFACTTAVPQDALERRAQALDRGLICPICPGETIDQSQATLAKQMQALAREMLAEGRTEGEIKDFFVERYGGSVLAAPPKEGFDLVVWVVPPVALLAAVSAFFLVVRAMTRSRIDDPASRAVGDVDAGLAPYLDVVDREIARAEGGGPPSADDPPSRER